MEKPAAVARPPGCNVLLIKLWKFSGTTRSVLDRSLTLVCSYPIDDVVPLMNKDISSLSYVSEKGKVHPYEAKFEKKGSNWHLDLDHEAQKYLEMNIICFVLDRLNTSGWRFVTQYEEEFAATKAGGLGGVTITVRHVLIYENYPPLQNGALVQPMPHR